MTEGTADNGPIFRPDVPALVLSAQGPEGEVRCVLSRPVSLVGARRDCDLPLPHTDISKVHAAVIWTGAGFIVRDLASRTGTRHNGQPVGCAPLRPGDVLEIGPVTVRVESGSSATDVPTAGADALRLPAPVTFEFAGRRLNSSDNALLIGRRHTADLVIDNPDVSVAHALVFAFEGKLAICDLGSRSGTVVNGRRIDCAFLRDQDLIEIGGEKIRVRWQAPVQQAASSHCSQRRDRTAGRDVPPDQDLDQSIAAVQSQLVAACSRIAQRTRELEDRRRELDVREAALDRARQEVEQQVAQVEAARREAEQRLARLSEEAATLEAQRKALEAERNALDHLRSELERQQAGLNQRLAEVAQQEAALRERAAGLEAASADVAARREALSALEREIRDQQAASRKLAEELGQHRAELEALARKLEAREAEVARREAELAQREARDAELLRKIEQFKAMLRQAGEMFASTSSLAEQKAGEIGAAGTSAPVPSGPPGQQDIPAPVVSEPIFGPGVPPSDWPRELQERFRVLRRLSRKPDQELLAQVWAERAQGGGAAASGSARRPN